MAVAWTTEQKQVISLRDRNILVSAAAGSGKTAVLVERIIAKLLDKDRPADVDRLLVVTFTEAAAAEMKERIRQAIEKKLEEEPENEHLNRQATLIHHAQITTIHSFCLSVIRDYFHTIDLEPGFRIMEEGERKLLMLDVMEELLEREYGEGKESFLDFAEAMAPGRDDKKLEELILQLYEFSGSNPDPEAWLLQCAGSYEEDTEWDSRSFVKRALENTGKYLEELEDTLVYAKAVCESPYGPAKYADTIVSDILKIRELSEKAGTFSGLREKMEALKFDRLPANKDKTVSEEKTALVKSLREQVKKEIQSLREQYFYDDTKELEKDMKEAALPAGELVRLTILFAREFEKKKRAKNMIDFSDMEQYALRILRKEEVAEEYRDKFEEIMIDEYQDSNLIQETLLTQISRIKKGQWNMFMVGDVKQSIYRFRLSRPELFMEKYETYTLTDGKQQRIDLHKNFRSRREVLDAVNFIFYQIMTRELGGVSYDKNAALYPGASFEEKEGFASEIWLIEEGKELETKELEARAAAKRIKELLKTQQVLDKESGLYRNASYKDIVILLRSLAGWTEVFTKVLNAEGIPTYSGTKEGYFKTREISLLLDYLRILDNEKQDLPLTAVLASWFGRLTNEELADIRCAYPEGAYHEAVRKYAEEGQRNGGWGNAQGYGKLTEFLRTLRNFRERVPYTAMHELLEEIVSETGYQDYILAMPGGTQRRANLDMLMEKAKAFESSSYKGLFHFIRYIEQLQKYDIDYGEANITDENADTVRIMSIHKSKGLEFPIVICAGLGKRFNRQDAARRVVIHQDLGIGMDAVYIKDRMQTASFLKRVIQKETVLENLGEELRVLYVAITRAKEKLIMTGVVKSAEEEFRQYERLRRQEELPLSFGLLSRAGSCLDFLIPAAVRLADRKEKGEKIPLNVEVLSEEELLLDSWLEEEQEQMTKEELLSLDVRRHDSEMYEKLRESFSYVYPYLDERGFGQKFTVSELKRRAYQSEGVQYRSEEEGRRLYEDGKEADMYVPKFMAKNEEMKGTQRGTAYHRVLELLDFAQEYTKESLDKAIGAFVEEGKMEKEAAEHVWRKGILSFLDSGCARRMRRAAKEGKLKKEQPFVIGVPAGRIYKTQKQGRKNEREEQEEILLVQGIIDLYFEEDGEIVLVDYKTDRVKTEKELIDKYRIQLDYYEEALTRSLGKKVKERMIYSFALQKEIRL